MTIPTTIKHMKTALPVLMIAVLSASCGMSPESAGKKIGAGLCDCRAQKQAQAFKTANTFLDDLNDGTFSSQGEAAERMRSLSKQVEREADACEQKVSDEEDEMLKDFLRDDDRGTIVNAKRMMVEECHEAREEEMKERAQELMELNTEIQKALTTLQR